MKNNKFTLVLLFCILFIGTLTAQEVKEIAVYSQAMDKEIKCTIVLPPNYHNDSSERFPVLYLLHGHGGNYKSWISLKPDLPDVAARHGFIIVCPDGNNSWYWDAPQSREFRYETFVAKELIQEIDRKYRTVADRKGRAITGLSMGGHGGLWLSIRHRDTFGAGGSTSGGVDIRPFPDNWNMKERLGEYDKNKDVWDKHTVINQVDQLKNNELKMIIDCGVNDFFIEVNRNLHKKLVEMKIDHDYIERPGAHNSEYWNNSIDYQALFFSKFFKQAEKSE